MTATADARFWNDLAETYAAKPVDNPEAFDRKTEVTLGLIERGHTVLDIGCGTGSFCLRLAATGAQVHGLDLSDEMIRIARAKAETSENVHFHIGPFDETFEAFGPGELDGLFAYSLLHLVPDRTAALQRAFDLLRPGGYFVASTVCLGESWVPYSPLLLAMRLVGKAPWVASRLSKAALHQEVKDVGFTDLRTPDVGAARQTDFLVARKPM
ncbi:MAG: class I SAM-dependent methyltransferase [Nannocystales bacterium]